MMGHFLEDHLDVGCAAATFEEPRERAQRHRFLAMIHIETSGEEDDRRVRDGGVGAHRFERFEAGHDRHHVIEDDEDRLLGRVGADGGEALVAIRCDLRGITQPAKKQGECLGGITMIVNE